MATRLLLALFFAAGLTWAEDKELTAYSLVEIDGLLQSFKQTYKNKKAPEEDAISAIIDLKKAYRYAMSGLYQFMQIRIEGVIGQPGQGDIGTFAMCPFRKGNAQNLCDDLGIFKKSFIKVSHTIEEDLISVTSFDFKILLHQGG